MKSSALKTEAIRPRIGHFVVNFGRANDIPAGQGRSFRVGRDRIAVFRTVKGEVFATQAWCPHQDGALDEGAVRDSYVVCPLLAHAFDLRTGDSVGSSSNALKTYPAFIDYRGDILVAID